MAFIRPIELSDLGVVKTFSVLAGIGMTHLPTDCEQLRKKILQSLDSFRTDVTQAGPEEYLFVLTENGEIGGICGIYASIGFHQPTHCFSIQENSSLPTHLPQPKEHRLLQLKAYHHGPSEICALFLSSEWRAKGLGKLLSWSRFLFMAAFLHRFQRNSLANIRGLLDRDQPLFWEGVGRRYVDLDFVELMRLRMKGQLKATDIFPQYPIPISLLSPETRSAIGAVHQQSEPAFRMLQQEGFRFVDEIDPYDGGPIIQVVTKEIAAIKKSVVKQVLAVEADLLDGRDYMLSNERLNFRCCYGVVKAQADGISISAAAAQALDVKVGDSVRYLKLAN